LYISLLFSSPRCFSSPHLPSIIIALSAHYPASPLCKIFPSRIFLIFRSSIPVRIFFHRFVLVHSPDLAPHTLMSSWL
jgi:hypothetical protein